MTSKHEFDAFLDTQDLHEPDYHEQLLAMQGFEEARENALKQQGAKEALQSLTITLSALCLREDVQGDYFFGLHEALEVVVKSNIGTMKVGTAKGGVL